MVLEVDEKVAVIDESISDEVGEAIVKGEEVHDAPNFSESDASEALVKEESPSGELDQGREEGKDMEAEGLNSPLGNNQMEQAAETESAVVEETVSVEYSFDGEEELETSKAGSTSLADNFQITEPDTTALEGASADVQSPEPLACDDVDALSGSIGDDAANHGEPTRAQSEQINPISCFFRFVPSR